MQKIAHCPILQNDYLEAMAQQLYDYWFVQFDFPDENGKPYKSSGGKMVWNDKLKRAIPEGWIVARLSDFIEEHISGDWGNDNLADSCMPVSCIRGADMKTMDDLPLRYIPVSHTDRLLHDGDIVIEISGGSPTQSTGRSVCITSRIIEENKGSLICSNFCHALVIKTPYKYFFHYLWQKLYENGNMFNFEGKTSGLRNLQLDSLCSSYWAFPRTKACLEAFNVKIDVFLEERDNNKHTIKALEEQRGTVLSLLMNGQVSIKPLNNHLSEWGALVFRNVVGFATQGIFQNCLYKVICSKVQGCFMDLTFVFKLHFTDLDRPPVSGLHPTILEMENNLCATLWILWKLLFEFFKGGYLFSFFVSDEVILCLNGEVGRCVPVIGFFKLETRIESAYLVQIEIVFFNPFVIKEVEGMPDIGMYNSSDGTYYLIPPWPA